MSFSAKQKADIIAQPIKNSCCRRALLQGVFSTRGEVKETEVLLSVDSQVTAEYLSNLIGENYNSPAKISTSDRGGRGRLLNFSVKSAESYISDFISGRVFFTERCPACQGAFLRGMFLASGRVTDPAKQYLLEFTPKKNAIERVCAFFEELGLPPRVSRKPRETVIYFKNSTLLEDFFALAGMNQTAFALMNAKIQGEIRNNVNRIANCETNNIGKAVSASMNQIAIIEELLKKGLISQLPEELEKTARLRMEHKDLSLAQLASIMTPPISKPGLSHRLKKITEIASTLLEWGKKS